MGNTCPDICDAVLTLMCIKCPHWKKCQNIEDDCNHDQMIQCMGHLTMSESDYPKDGEYEPMV